MGEQMKPEEIRSAIEHMSASGKLSKELERLFISVHTHLGRIAELEERCKGAEELAHSEHKNMLAYRNRRIALRDSLLELAEKWDSMPSFYDILTAQETCQSNARELRALLGKESGE